MKKIIKNALKKRFRNVLTMMKCSAYHEHIPKAIFETGRLHFTYSRKKDLFAYKKEHSITVFKLVHFIIKNYNLCNLFPCLLHSSLFHKIINNTITII